MSSLRELRRPVRARRERSELRLRAPGGAYLEREPAGERAEGSAVRARIGLWLRARQLVRIADAQGAELTALSDAGLLDRARALRRARRRGRDRGAQLLARSLALACEGLRRVLGREPGRVERRAAAAISLGAVCELARREGADEALALAAGVAGLGELPVHVLCASESRARWLAYALDPLARRLGLRVALLDCERRARNPRRAYRADVTCAAAEHVAEDYLRDLADRDLGHVRRVALAVERLHGGRARVDGLRLRGLGVALLADADELLCERALEHVASGGRGLPGAQCSLAHWLARYWRRGGICPAAPPADELWRAHRLSLLRVGRRPRAAPLRLFVEASRRDAALVERVRRAVGAGARAELWVHAPRAAGRLEQALREVGLDVDVEAGREGHALRVSPEAAAEAPALVVLAQSGWSARRDQRLLEFGAKGEGVPVERFLALSDLPVSARFLAVCRRWLPAQGIYRQVGPQWLARAVLREVQRRAARAESRWREGALVAAQDGDPTPVHGGAALPAGRGRDSERTGSARLLSGASRS